MDENIVNLAALSSAAGVPLDEARLGMLEKYSLMLREWNEKMNLTAITSPEGIAVKHFYDSLLLLTSCAIPEGSSVIDIGTGAGFPGVVLKIARPDIHLTLLDSLNKRLVFLKELTAALGIEADIIHGRAEECAKAPMRERFDVATARAVAALPALCEYCLPYVRPGGIFVAMKGPSAAEELEASKNAIAVLGGGNAEVTERKLPEGDVRCFVTVKKVSQTPTKYPRIGAKISKNPL